MAVVSGIQCDWCGKTAKLEGDRSLPKDWSRIAVTEQHHVPGVAAGGQNYSLDLCSECFEAADKALGKAKKRRQTGKVQR